MNEKVKQLVKEVGGLEVHDTRGYGDGHEGFLLTAEQLEHIIHLVVIDSLNVVENKIHVCRYIHEIELLRECYTSIEQLLEIDDE